MGDEPENQSRMKKLYAAVRTALEGRGIEKHGDSHMTALEKFLHFWVLVYRGFITNRCPVRASALAYTTLLALIPLLAVVASVSVSLLKSKGEQPIEMMIEKIVSNVAPQLDLVSTGEDETEGRRKVVASIKGYIDNISSGALGVTGMAGLVFVAILLLSTIESTFNDIWGVTHGRTWLARIIQYWATVTLGPLLPLMAMALNTGTQFKAVEQKLASMPLIGHILVGLIPFVILSLAFALLYQLMPNTRVRWQAALVGGAVGGSLWQINSLMNVVYASRMENYSSIYGPLSLVPIFLVGLYLSWMILLFGAQVAYTFQNRSVYFQERQAENINELGREFVALRIMTQVAHHFKNSLPPPSAIEIGQKLVIPTGLVGDVMQTMVDNHLAVEIDGKETAYTVGRPLDQISCHDILQAVRTGKGEELDTSEEPFRELVRKEFHRIQQAEQAVASSVTLDKLAEDPGSADKKVELPSVNQTG